MPAGLITRLSACLNLEPAILEGLSVVASPFAIGSGEVIFKQGESATGMYVIDRGRVQIKARTPGDDALSILELGEGEIFGELSFLDEEDRSASAVALTSVTGWWISRAGFRGLLHGHQPVAGAVLRCIQRQVAGRIRQTLCRIGASRSVVNPQRQASPALPCWSIADAAMISLLDTSATSGSMFAPRWAHLLEDSRQVEILRGARLEPCERHGDEAHLLWVVRGAVRECMARGSELEQLWVAGPGTLVAVVGFVDGETHPLTLQAAEDALLLAVPHRGLARIAAQDPVLGIFVQDLIGEQLALAQRRVNRHLGRTVGLQRFNQTAEH